MAKIENFDTTPEGIKLREFVRDIDALMKEKGSQSKEIQAKMKEFSAWAKEITDPSMQAEIRTRIAPSVIGTFLGILPTASSEMTPSRDERSEKKEPPAPANNERPSEAVLQELRGFVKEELQCEKASMDTYNAYVKAKQRKPYDDPFSEEFKSTKEALTKEAAHLDVNKTIAEKLPSSSPARAELESMIANRTEFCKNELAHMQVVEDRTKDFKKFLDYALEQIQLVLKREGAEQRRIYNEQMNISVFGAVVSTITGSDPSRELMKQSGQRVAIAGNAIDLLREAKEEQKKGNTGQAIERVNIAMKVLTNANKFSDNSEIFKVHEQAIRVTRDIGIATIVTVSTLGVGAFASAAAAGSKSVLAGLLWAGAEGAAISGTASAGSNIDDVRAGNKTGKEAAKDIATDTALGAGGGALGNLIGRGVSATRSAWQGRGANAPSVGPSSGASSGAAQAEGRAAGSGARSESSTRSSSANPKESSTGKTASAGPDREAARREAEEAVRRYRADKAAKKPEGNQDRPNRNASDKSRDQGNPPNERQNPDKKQRESDFERQRAEAMQKEKEAAQRKARDEAKEAARHERELNVEKKRRQQEEAVRREEQRVARAKAQQKIDAIRNKPKNYKEFELKLNFYSSQ